ncbi:MAG: M23 family metallopeptidase [Deltaproteobacteria bacterium]|nr:M23 family metallopeptidase [Deltaproteobacteria bacterium]
MATDETPPSVPTLRPLPSLGVPLLREEIERARRRRVVIGGLVIGGLAVIGVTVALATMVGGGPADDDDVEHATVPTHVGYTPPADAAVPPPDTFVPSVPVATEELPVGTRTVHHFGQSAGFRPALISAGLAGADADAIITALTGVMDFRRCRPDHELVFERDAVGVLQRFEYRATITQIYEARRGPDGALHGAQVEVPIERIDLARGGTVVTSLGDALEQIGLGRTLVGTFVEVFEGRMNFNTETRAGDSFRLIVVEERIDGAFLRYGTVQALEYHSARRGVLQAFHFAPPQDPRTSGGVREGARPSPDEGDFYDETGRAVHGGWLRTPLRYDHISSPFDPRRMHPVLHRVMPHNGIDYSAATGTPVWAAADGTVTWAGDRGPNGNLVSLSHEGGYESHYAHLSRFAAGLARGQHVEQRQVIGYVGTTGRSTGPHLHFGLERHGRFVDPARELNGPGRMLPASLTGRFRQEIARLRGLLQDIEIAPVAAPATPPAEAEPATSHDDVMD